LEALQLSRQQAELQPSLALLSRLAQRRQELRQHRLAFHRILSWVML
jgi:hypothetical protein